MIAPVIAKPIQMILRIETTISSRNVIRYRNKAAVSVAILAFGFMLALVGTMYVNSMYEGMKKDYKTFTSGLSSKNSSRVARNRNITV